MQKPDIVLEVENIARMSADEMGNPADRVYVSHSDGEWRIGDNYEQVGYTLIYREEKWYLRNFWDGEDNPCSNPHGEAELMFHG